MEITTPLQKPKHREHLNKSLKTFILHKGVRSHESIDPYLRMDVKPAHANKIKTSVIYLPVA